MSIIKEPKLEESLSDSDFLKLLTDKEIAVDEDLLFDNYTAFPLKNYFLLTYLPELLAEEYDELTRYYNRYFWLSTLSARYQKKFGRDNGLEQQVFKILEEADSLKSEVDWKIVEQLQNESRQNI